MSGDDPTKDDADAYPWLKFWLRFTIAITHPPKGVTAFSSISPWLVLSFLRTVPDQEVSVADIVEGSALSERSVTRALAALESAGYVARRQANDDARTEHLRVTKEGRIAIGILFHATQPLP